MPATQLHADKAHHLTDPYPEGESWTDAVERVGWFLQDLHRIHDRQRVLVIGHVATRWGLQHHLEGRPVAELIKEEFDWQLGWEYQLPVAAAIQS